MTSPPLRFYAGTAGALAPFVLFLAGVIGLALAGAPDERGFWPVLLAAWMVGLALATDRQRYAETLITGMAQPLVLLMIVAWLLAGVLSTLLGAAGFVQALAWAAGALSLTGGAYVALSFLSSALVATATGTSFGTILVCGPLLYPAGAGAGADPTWLAGALLAGATFGDSISPISDTTIASAGTQHTDIGGTVRTRLRYVLPAGLLSLVVYALMGGATRPVTEVVVAASPAGWPLVMVPLLIVGLLLRQQHLIEALLGGIALTIAMGLGLGLLRPMQLLHLEPGSYAASSLIIEGLQRGVGVSVFTLLLVGLLRPLEASGVLDQAMGRLNTTNASPVRVESRIVAVAMGAVLLTTHSVVALLTVGDYVRRLGEASGISAYRRANLLDLSVCTWPFLLPYFLPPILMAGATASGEAMGWPRLSPWATGVANVYSWSLLGIIAVALTTGAGRGERKPQ
jgi:Na+/H+ antiporter NhaC